MNDDVVPGSDVVAILEPPANYGARKWRSVKLLLAYSAFLGIIVCFLPEESTPLDLIFGLPILLLGISWCLADAMERGHRIGPLMKLSLLFLFIVGLPVYLFQTRGVGAIKTLALTLVLIVAMGACLFVTTSATFYIGAFAGLWEVVY